ncbi:MAG: aromatic ring-hydroxylating dioxygenase subunit alpha [Sandaracinaceae bacterium]|nr:aromatic ring-hydroxylating dioxygenase subunit alpha [Sandaracinaceae bacterium]
MFVIDNAWYAVLDARELRERPVAARRFGLELVFWRTGGGVAAAVDECPHRRAKLSPGRVRDGCIECPFHGFRFDGAGACTAIPAHPDRPIPKAMALRSIEAREAHGLIWVWTGRGEAGDAPIPFFDFDGWSWAGSQLAVPVNAHYTRTIENQLDFTHLPFVHRTTIGRSLPPVMDVVTEVEGDRIRAYLRDQPDGAFLELLGPNVWRLKTGPTWQFLAFAPIDEEHMLYYVRTYQRMVTVPGLAWLFGALTRFTGKIILDQDTPLVESQPPGEARLRNGELLVPSDGPIIAYRRWREERRVEVPWGRAELVPPERLVAAK